MLCRSLFADLPWPYKGLVMKNKGMLRDHSFSYYAKFSEKLTSQTFSLYAKFSKKLKFLAKLTTASAYQWVKNASFRENLPYVTMFP